MQKFITTSVVRLDQFVCQVLGVSRSYAQKLIKEEMVKIGDELIVRPSYKTQVGQEVYVCNYEKNKDGVDEIVKTQANYSVLYEDEYLLIVNKPPQLTTHIGTGNIDNTLVNALLYNNVKLSDIAGKERLGIVHRLDKDTSGCLIIAKDNDTHLYLKKQFKERKVKRIYLGLVEGTFREQSGIWKTIIGRKPKDRKKMAVVKKGKEAITKYKVVDEYANKYSLVEFELVTGRTHQIRVHCKYFSKPLVGDKTYGGASKLKANHQLLHAKSVSFIHHKSGQNIYIEAPINDHFRRILDKLS